jgi:hypothetical protein
MIPRENQRFDFVLDNHSAFFMPKEDENWLSGTSSVFARLIHTAVFGGLHILLGMQAELSI